MGQGEHPRNNGLWVVVEVSLFLTRAGRNAITLFLDLN